MNVTKKKISVLKKIQIYNSLYFIHFFSYASIDKN